MTAESWRPAVVEGLQVAKQGKDQKCDLEVRNSSASSRLDHSQSETCERQDVSNKNKSLPNMRSKGYTMVVGSKLYHRGRFQIRHRGGTELDKA